MANKTKIILVTGGAGYVGSTFIRDALAEGYQVRCLDILIYGGKSLVGFINHPNFEFVKGDIRDKKVVQKSLENMDFVVHLAAIVGDRPCQAAPTAAFQINFEGTQVLADMSKKANIKRFVFSSTCSNYGVSEGSRLVDEESRLNPVSLYAETKIDCERYLKDISDENFKVTCLRFGTAYGISFRTRFDLLVNSLAFEAWAKNEIIVFAANTWRPYIHVADMSLIIRQILKAPPEKVTGKTYNAGSMAQNYLKRDIVKILKKSMPEIKTKNIDSIDDKRNYRVNFKKIETCIGFKPSRTVKDGFEELFSCFRNGILTEKDFEANKIEALEKFFKEKENLLKK